MWQKVVTTIAEEHCFSFFMKNLSGLAWVKDLKGRYVYANDDALAAFGKSKEELYGKTDDEIFPPETAAQFKANDQTALETGVSKEVETLRWPDGRLHYSLVTKFAMKNDKGDPALVGGMAVDITFQKEAEESIRRWKHIFDHSGWAAATVNCEDNLLETVNRAFADLHGCTVEELVGQPLVNTFVQEERGRLPKILEKVYSSNDGGFIYEVDHIRKDGSRFPCLTHDSVFRDEQGKPLFRAAIFQDLTPLKKVTEFRNAITSNMGEGLYSVDAQGLVTYMNPAAETMLGWTFEELKGRRMHDVTHHHYPDGRPFPIEECAGFGVLRDGTPLKDYDDYFIKKDGTFFPVNYSSSPLLAGDKAAGLVVVFRDMTDRKATEEALRVNEARQAAMFATALDGIILIDHKGLILDFNHAAESIFGFRRDEIIGKEMAELIIPPEFREKYRLGLARCVATGQSSLLNQRMEFPALRSDGTRIDVEVAITNINYRSPPVFTGYVRDITKAKQSEAKLKEADRRKDEFLAMLAHELRNPLAPIKNAVHILNLPELKPEEAQNSLAMIERQVQTLVRLVDDLLDVSRIIRDKITLKKENVSIKEIVERALETSTHQIEANGHRLSVSLPTEPVWVHGDLVRLAQVISNLLSNSAKYTERGGRIWLLVEEDDGTVAIRVRDNGSGISPEFLPFIFDLFTQGKRTLSRSQGGMGIGLTLVQKLVQMHGGNVAVHSEGLGKGSEFLVRLPKLSEPPGDNISLCNKNTKAVNGGKGPARSLRACRILVVDDNVDSADSLSSLLKASGHTTLCAYDGCTALDLVQKWQPQYCILDIGLPDKNGYEVARELRNNPQTAKMKLLAITGYGQKHDRDRALEAGFDLHLVKPVHLSDVEAFLQEGHDDSQP